MKILIERWKSPSTKIGLFFHRVGLAIMVLVEAVPYALSSLDPMLLQYVPDQYKHWIAMIGLFSAIAGKLTVATQKTA